jgi:membrane associated rhomboid family serine protease
MSQASVGFHCPSCTKQGAQKVLRAHHLAPTGLVTRVLIGINVAVFVMDAATGGGLLDGGGELSLHGVLYAPWIDQDGELWRILTAGFLHVGAFHLAMNMYALWILGPQLEHALGPRWFLATYVTALVGGSFGALLLDPLSPSAGASGAIYGLFGLAIVLQRARGIDPWSSGLATVLMLNLFITFSVPRISIGGHLGGLAAGAAVGWLFVEVGVRSRRDREAFAASLALGAALFAACIWAAARWVTAV